MFVGSYSSTYLLTTPIDHRWQPSCWPGFRRRWFSVRKTGTTHNGEQCCVLSCSCHQEMETPSTSNWASELPKLNTLGNLSAGFWCYHQTRWKPLASFAFPSPMWWVVIKRKFWSGQQNQKDPLCGAVLLLGAANLPLTSGSCCCAFVRLVPKTGR